MENKNEIRDRYLIIRKNIINKNNKSIQIFNALIKSEEYINSKVIGIYKSLDSEVNTNELINYSLNQGIIVCLPKVENNDINFYKIRSLDDELIKSKFNIYEPISSVNNLVSKTSIDLIIVPGICFDKSLNRIGFGKGYYDRFLCDTCIKKIGICFNEQIVDKIDNSDYDIKMDKIITDKTVIIKQKISIEIR